MKKACLFFLVFYIPFFLQAQTVIEGHIETVAHTPLANVSITAGKLDKKIILAFAISDNNGFFKLTINSKDDSLTLRASLLGYLVAEDIISNKTAIHSFTLTQTAVALKEVVVKNNPIRTNKDTLNYSVSSFAGKEDRSIADVIKKLPGMEVQDDGKILYQGKPIQAFLVNGLDLLEGKYGLASNNLPNDAVKNVQVIENDQRIKVLDSLVFSDKTTLNLQLKKFLTTGSAKVGIGTSPLLWDANITPITYNKTFQAINSYQSNNTGNDNAKQLQVLTPDDIFSGNKPNAPILSIAQLSAPPFDQQFWLDNNLHLFSSNLLKVLKKDVQVKFNISYVNDYQQRLGSTNTIISTPAQTISLAEIKQNGLNKNSLQTGFVLEKNTKGEYLKNIFHVEKEWDNTTGNLVNNGNNIYQKLADNPFLVSNKLSIIKPVGAQLININSTISYNSLSQALSVGPGQYDSVFNNNKPYDEVVQYLTMNKFQTNNYLGFIKGFKRFTLAPKLGFEVQNQDLGSTINTVTSNVVTELGVNFKNDLSLLKTNIYEELNTQYQLGDFKTGILLHISEQKYLLKNLLQGNNTATSRLLFEPQFNLQAKIKQKLSLNIFSSLRNTFGEISQLYNAYILQSYRSLQRLNTILPENAAFSSGASLNFKDDLKGIFYSIGYSFRSAKMNLLFTNTIDVAGFYTLQSVLKDNFQQSQSVNGSFSKYISGIKTVIKLNTGINFNNSQQVINNIISEIGGKSYTFGLSFNNSLFKHLTWNYDGYFSSSNSYLSGKQISNIDLQHHSVRVNYFPTLRQLFSVNSMYYYNGQSPQSNRAFINLLYRVTTKKKIDFELNCTNLLNSKYFSTASTDGFTSVTNTFQMRPRQFLFSVRFSF